VGRGCQVFRGVAADERARRARDKGLRQNDRPEG
jgi:hypothetical protein